MFFLPFCLSMVFVQSQPYGASYKDSVVHLQKSFEAHSPIGGPNTQSHSSNCSLLLNLLCDGAWASLTLYLPGSSQYKQSHG